jgi:hypothetical protein
MVILAIYAHLPVPYIGEVSATITRYLLVTDPQRLYEPIWDACIDTKRIERRSEIPTVKVLSSQGISRVHEIRCSKHAMLCVARLIEGWQRCRTREK